jgi:sugar-specific transcriptional regulator TrmB
MDKIHQILGKIGLTKQESKVYLALLELQESQTGKLCKFTKIASSNIYKILDSLIEKGLIHYRVQNNIKIFMSAPPESLNDLFLQKQKKLDEERKEINGLISNLKKIEIKKEPHSNYKYYEGLGSLKSMWHEINTNITKDSKLFYYTAKKESYERMIGFYTEHHKIRTKKKAIGKMIFPIEDKKLAKDREKIDKKFEAKFLNLKNDAEWGVIGDLFYIQYITGKKPRGFLIKDKTFADTFKQVFKQLWKLNK